MAAKSTKTIVLPSVSWRTLQLGIAIILMMFLINRARPALLAIAELKASDLRVSLLPVPTATDRVVIAKIDDASIQRLGQWPWARATFAQLVNTLADYGVAVIVSDVLLTERDERDVSREAITKRLRELGLKNAQVSEILGQSNDGALAQAIRSQGSTVLSYAFSTHQMRGKGDRPLQLGFRTDVLDPPPLAYNLVRESHGVGAFFVDADEYLPPIPILNSAAHSTAFVDIDADLDGSIRHELTVINFKNRACVPLFLAALSAYSNQQLSMVADAHGVERIAKGTTAIPVDEMGRMLVRFRGSLDAIPGYSISDIIDRRVPPEKLRGRIVLIGVTGKGLGDRAVTPVDKDFPRVAIHANAIDNVLRGDLLSYSQSSVAIDRIAGVALGIAVAFATAATSALSALTLSVLFGVGYLVYAQHLLAANGVLIGVVFPEMTVISTFLALVSYRYITEGREKRYLRQAFEKYLDPDVIESLLTNPGGFKLGGERKNLSILFADIVNYTGLSERTDPAALVSLLNDYMTRMTDRIMKNGGVVDKIRGDGIMAFWGAPNEVPNHARAAIDSAVEMVTELSTLKKTDPRFKDLDMGIGIATGEAIVGNFGGERRFDYSVIGDTVNLASRLEGLTRHFKVHLIVSRDTFAQAGDAYVAREIGLVKVKGKTKPVPIVEVVGDTGNGADPAYYQRCRSVLEMIQSGANGNARKELEQLLAERPDDEVTRIYLEKLDASGEAPGELVFEFDTK